MRKKEIREKEKEGEKKEKREGGERPDPPDCVWIADGRSFFPLFSHSFPFSLPFSLLFIRTHERTFHAQR
jgi:hypothetical protein